MLLVSSDRTGSAASRGHRGRELFLSAASKLYRNNLEEGYLSGFASCLPLLKPLTIRQAFRKVSLCGDRALGLEIADP